MEKISSFEVKRVKILVESQNFDDLLECIEKTGFDVEKIGEGGNAEVFSVQDGPMSKFCLKKIKTQPQIKDQNIEREHQYQIEARKAGVTTPLSVISFESDHGSYLIMEKINGFTIRQIAEKPQLLPKNFDVDMFISELTAMIKGMHNANIVHRDLNAGNVMVNTQGKPVIIDFGTATHGTANSELAYEETVLLKNQHTGAYEQKSGFFIDDIKNLKNTIIPTIRHAVSTHKPTSPTAFMRTA